MNKPAQIESVEWRDLVALTPLEKTWELALGLPWLFLSLWCYGHRWWWAGLTCSFYLFLTGLRQSHNAQHYALGLPRPIQDIVLSILSLVMLASMHAVQVTHLHHHRHCLEDEDGEGATARLVHHVPSRRIGKSGESRPRFPTLGPKNSVHVRIGNVLRFDLAECEAIVASFTIRRL
jgi:hypothetical protein